MDDEKQAQFAPKSSVAQLGVWAMLSVALVAASGSIFLMIAAEPGSILAERIEPSDLSGTLMVVAFSIVGSLVVFRGNAPRYGWLMLALAMSGALIMFAGLYGLHSLTVDLPVVSAAIWVQDLWFVTWMIGLLLLPALFPNGKVASNFWRVPVRAAILVWIILTVVFSLIDRPATNWFQDLPAAPDNPLGFLQLPEVFAAMVPLTWVLISLASVAIGVGSLVTRWRVSRGEMRQQMKWVMWSFGVILVGTALDVVNSVLVSAAGSDLGLDVALSLAGAISVLVFVLSMGFAVLRYRLYQVDLVINRTIVYGILTFSLLVVYAGVVVGVGGLFNTSVGALALLATGLVAVAFAPLRAYLQRMVNRRMFGQRDDPYVVLSDLGRLMAETGAPDDILRHMVETIAVSLKLPGAAVQFQQEEEWSTRARFGDEFGVDSQVEIVPLRHQGELVGRLLVMPRSPNESLSAKDKELLNAIAHQAGAIVRSVRLTVVLQASRERLVFAREEERRRIRRDLHDGLGPSLASQTFQLDDVLDRLHNDPSGAADLVMGLKEQNQQLVADIRRLVYELRPPALDELGVAGALSAHVAQFERSGQLSIEVCPVPDPLPELSAALEVAAYRIAREAVTNTVRHSGASLCKVKFEVTDHEMVVTISDNGLGVSPEAEHGVGLTSMRERTEELGGVFTITTSAASGTELTAVFPLDQVELSEVQLVASSVRDE